MTDLVSKTDKEFDSMKTLKLLGVVLAILFLTATPAFAQSSPNSVSLSGAGIGAGIGAAFCIVGAGYGFGRIGSAALESMARQPEVKGQVQTAMIIIAALLEGATFFALLICIQLAGKVTTTF
jgi:F-type H+-transporting ATPase subunit c